MKEILKDVELEIERRRITPEEIAETISSIPPLLSRRIIMGYASVAMVDRENQKISIEALREAVKRFMTDGRYRIISIFHSDAVVGRVLPKWTDPNTGKVYATEVDDVGWKVVVELRDDIELAEKVWDEIQKGNLRSFSVAGTSKKKHNDTSSGNPYTEIDELDLLECTICLPENELVWTKRGLVAIKDISTNDFVFTHNGKWQKVNKVMCRNVDENITKITTENGFLSATNNHPIRILKYEGRHGGTHYDWTPIEDVKVGDLVSCHLYERSCRICGTPIFGGSHIARGNKYYCSVNCHSKDVGNRKGKTIASGDLGAIKKSKTSKGITKKDNPKLTGGWRTEEGRSKGIDSIRARWKDPEFAQKMFIKWGKRPNKTESYLNKILQDSFPNEWKYVGDGQVWIDGKNPDFININGSKKIIELDGEYWHKDKNSKERIKLFKKFGYETLVITDKELKNGQYLDKLKEFCGNKLSKVMKVEQIHYCGKVYNLSVENDESYTAEFAVVHNCSVPVNQMSVFSVLWEGKDRVAI